MTADVLPFTRQKWATGARVCAHCGHEWTAVFQSDAQRLECPACRRMTNFAEWQCSCGCCDFALLPSSSIVCRACDAVQMLRTFEP